MVVKNPVVTLVPEEFREEWDPDEFLPKPDVDFELDWVYGFQASGSLQNSNLIFLQNVRKVSSSLAFRMLALSVLSIA